jgi:hypothetical protein
MAEVANLNQVGVLIDVAARVALYAMAKSCDPDEILEYFDCIKEVMANEYKDTGITEAESNEIIEQFKNSALLLRKKLVPGDK